MTIPYQKYLQTDCVLFTFFNLQLPSNYNLNMFSKQFVQGKPECQVYLNFINYRLERIICINSKYVFG